MGVEPEIGVFYPPKWMMKISWKTLLNKGMIWGVAHPTFGLTPILDKQQLNGAWHFVNGGFANCSNMYTKIIFIHNF